jgi:putative GTP pyrophosphokinase
VIPSRTTEPQPAAEPPFSKGQVNRAGRLLLAVADAASRPGSGHAAKEYDAGEIATAFEAVTWWRTLHARPLSNVAANLRYHVDREEGRIGGRTEVVQRLKRETTMIDKLAREPKMQVTQMQDIAGVRALLPSLSHVYAVSRRLRKTWTIIRVRDYIADPKSSGYRALHLIVRRGGCPVEVQLRTILQDAWANQVEEDGRRIGVGLKFGAGVADIHAYYAGVSDAFAFLDRGETIPAEPAAALDERYAKIRGTLSRGEQTTP